jgi:ribosome-associated protein
MSAVPPNPVEPSGVEVAPGVFLPESALDFTAMRASGPGGQHVNKASTKIRLRVALAALSEHLPADAVRRLRAIAGSRLTGDDDIVITCDESRSAVSNRRTCVERLRELLVHALRRPRVRKRTRPTRASKERRIESKKQRGHVKKLRRRPGRET